MNQINGNNIHDDYYDRVDQNRVDRVKVTYPSATETLDIKFFEETDTDAENDGI